MNLGRKLNIGLSFLLLLIGKTLRDRAMQYVSVLGGERAALTAEQSKTASFDLFFRPGALESF